MSIVRAIRMAAIFVAIFGVLFLRFAAGIVRETEADRAVPWAALAVALLVGVGAWAMEVTGSATPARRDFFWALTTALVGFSILRLAGLL